METPDARHLTIETQEYLRHQAIRLRLQGKRVKDISEYLGIHRNTVSDWWWQYEHYGESALSQQLRGRQVGDGRILSPLDEADVQAAMEGHFPEEYEIDSALWTRQAVQALIEQLCVSRCRFARWGNISNGGGIALKSQPSEPMNRILKRCGNGWKKRIQRLWSVPNKRVRPSSGAMNPG